MQVGGNMKATSYFRSNGCTTKDSKQKYNSNVAARYKAIVGRKAADDMKMYGTIVSISFSIWVSKFLDFLQ